jgi:hypothetical protein
MDLDKLKKMAGAVRKIMLSALYRLDIPLCSPNANNYCIIIFIMHDLGPYWWKRDYAQASDIESFCSERSLH